MRRYTSVGSGNRSIVTSGHRPFIRLRKRAIVARRRLTAAVAEVLESRICLSTWTALPVVDGTANSLRYYIDKANTNGQNDTIYLKAARYDLAIPGRAENANQTGDLDYFESSRSLTLKGAGINKTF